MKYIIIVSLFLASCTDAGMGKLKAIGNSASVKCFSGGQVIYDGTSTGKVISEQNSDGYYFVDKETRLPMEVSGNCVIKYDDK